MIVHGSCLAVTQEWASHFQLLLTDPPYSRHVHKSAVSCESKAGQRELTAEGLVRVGLTGTKRRDLGFGHLTPQLRRHVARIASAVERWGLIYSDVESSQWMRIACQAAGAIYIRTIPWVRWSMPQMTGTIPPQGFEHVLCTFGKRGKSKAKGWNGPGNLVSLDHDPEIYHLDHTALRGDEKHLAEKPLDQALDLVSYFSNPGDRVLDLFSGSGVFGQACRLLDRHYVGFEDSEEWSVKGAEREIRPLTLAEVTRLYDWVNKPDTGAHTPKSLERQRLRELDRMRVIRNAA